MQDENNLLAKLVNLLKYKTIVKSWTISLNFWFRLWSDTYNFAYYNLQPANMSVFFISLLFLSWALLQIKQVMFSVRINAHENMK